MQYMLFGFGSLINVDSLKATAPDATNIRPAHIKGFVRDFSLWDDVGWTQTNLDLAGIPFCALDIRPTKKSNALVNGIAFEVSPSGFIKLKEREQQYKAVQTLAYDHETNEPIGECWVFIAGKNNGKYVKDSEAQTRYLETCLAGAKTLGDEFYEEFLRTTYIGNKSLDQIL